MCNVCRKNYRKTIKRYSLDTRRIINWSDSLSVSPTFSSDLYRPVLLRGDFAGIAITLLYYLATCTANTFYLHYQQACREIQIQHISTPVSAICTTRRLLEKIISYLLSNISKAFMLLSKLWYSLNSTF